MCGITGILAPLDQKTKSLNQVNALLLAQAHRGRDARKKESFDVFNTCVVLGHNRLSIVDQSVCSNQPMMTKDKRYVVTYNGEIYNYQIIKNFLKTKDYVFTTNSDTEVVLYAFSHWREEAIHHLNGMYALAILDTQTNEIFLYRDRFGIKPLYYVDQANCFAFSSHAKSLANLFNLKPNFNYISRGVMQWVYEKNGNYTQYEGLNTLLAGYYLKIKIMPNHQLSIINNQYYDFLSIVTAKIKILEEKSMQELSLLVTEQLKKAIESRLPPNLPLAISLSGGLDSSTILSLLFEKKQNICAFSFANPVNRNTEAKKVLELTRLKKVSIHFIDWPNQIDEIIQAFWDTLEFQQAPFVNFSVVAQYLVYQRIKESGFNVAFSGQGADEFFMGYRKFWFFYLKMVYKQGKYLSLCSTLMQLMPTFFYELSAINQYIRSLTRYSQSAHHLLSKHLLLSWNSTESTLGKVDSMVNSMIEHQINDIYSLSLPTLLRYEDANSMGNTIETRLPFMDFELAELAVALPLKLKLRHGYGKWIIRSLMKDNLPKSINWDRKNAVLISTYRYFAIPK